MAPTGPEPKQGRYRALTDGPVSRLSLRTGPAAAFGLRVLATVGWVAELQYLFEIGRTSQPGAIVVQDLTQRIGLGISTASFSHVVTNASTLTWTRDPFDRLIVGQAWRTGSRC